MINYSSDVLLMNAYWLDEVHDLISYLNGKKNRIAGVGSSR